MGDFGMRYGDAIKLFRADGSQVKAKYFYLKPTGNLAEGLITDDGRIIYCRDGQKALFWFKDTEETLFLQKP